MEEGVFFERTGLDLVGRVGVFGQFIMSLLFCSAAPLADCLKFPTFSGFLTLLAVVFEDRSFFKLGKSGMSVSWPALRERCFWEEPLVLDLKRLTYFKLVEPLGFLLFLWSSSVSSSLRLRLMYSVESLEVRAFGFSFL